MSAFDREIFRCSASMILRNGAISLREDEGREKYAVRAESTLRFGLLQGPARKAG